MVISKEPMPIVGEKLDCISYKKADQHESVLESLYHSKSWQYFSLSPDFLGQFAGKQPRWDDIAYITYKRTYSRLKPDGLSEEFWETLQRVVEGCYTIQKTHCKSLGLPWNDDKAQRSAQRMFEKMWDFKFLPPGRGLWAMGTAHVYKHGSMSLNNCFSRETEIITKNGVKQIGDLSGTTHTLLSKGGKWIDAPIKSFGVQKLVKLTVKRYRVEKEIFCTRDHRWFAQSRKEPYRSNGMMEFKTVDLPENASLAYVYGQGINGSVRPSPYGIAHGICYGDGTNGEYNNWLYLCGDKKELEKFFPLNEKSIDEKVSSAGAIRVADLPNYFKQLPSIQETKSYLYGWLVGYFAADGSCHADGTCILSSSKKEDLEFVRDVCVTIGIGCHDIRQETRDKEIDGKIYENHTMYFLSLASSTLSSEFFLMEKHRNNFVKKEGERERWKVVSIEETDREEEVFCAVVPDLNSFALEGNILTGNCGFVSTKNLEITRTKPFEFMMDASMLGVGVGFDTKGAGSIMITEPDSAEYVFKVPDSRQGWIEAMRRLLVAFFDGDRVPVFDFSLVRPRGSAIKGFGGVSSGPDPLKKMLASMYTMLVEKIGGWLTSVDIVDLMNLIGKCVVSGNVRRSAQIALGSPHDMDYVTMKDPEQFNGELMDHRWASNNSIVVDPETGFDYGNVARSISKNGEPGIVWLDNARKYSRMHDPVDWKDKNVCGVNPCGEQSLESYELCCLVETFPSLHENYAEFKETLKLAYLYAKSVTLMRTHWGETNAVMLKNRRIGTSISGIVDAFVRHGRRNFLKWLQDGYEYLKQVDDIYSNWLCIPKSIKITTVKPSGTTSLLAGVSPGIHYPHSKYYIRRIRIDADSDLIPALESCGYHIEPDAYGDNKTLVVSFPVKIENFSMGKRDVSMEMQLMNAIDIQKYWSDNQVSITVTFNKAEASRLGDVLQFCEDKLKGVSFLPLSDHGYAQAPYEEITGEQYHELSSKIKTIGTCITGTDGVGVHGCDGDRCTL